MEIKPFKIKVTPEQSKIVQEVLFANGIRWNGLPVVIMHESSKHLYVEHSITCGHPEPYFNLVNLPELTFEQFQELYCQVPKDPYKFIFGIDPASDKPDKTIFDSNLDGYGLLGNVNDVVKSNQHIKQIDIKGSGIMEALKGQFDKPRLTAQQEIDERLHEFGHNIPQQELVSIPDDRLDKIIERFDMIIELGNKIVEILCAPTDGDEIDDFEVKFHD